MFFVVFTNSGIIVVAGFFTFWSLNFFSIIYHVAIKSCDYFREVGNTFEICIALAKPIFKSFIITYLYFQLF
jgi:hypothetical protein